jgi:hypothetical protein
MFVKGEVDLVLGAFLTLLTWNEYLIVPVADVKNSCTLISFGCDELQIGALLRLSPFVPHEIAPREVSGGNVKYMISPSSMLIADSTFTVYVVVSPLILLRVETYIELNCCTWLAWTIMPVLAVSIVHPALSETSILKDSDGSNVRGF